MLDHLSIEPRLPERTVVLGGSGFVGRSLCQRLKAASAPLLALSSEDLDLCSKDAANALLEQLREHDALVLVSARAPCKSVAGLMENLAMAQAVCDVLPQVDLSHLVYVSSDAVYRDGVNPVSELSCADPTSLHGIMHRAREVMLQTSAGDTPLAVLRPSLLYGAHDPHNGYGPNRFRRQVAAGEAIRLFGNGEERRDHVFIDDVGELLYRTLAHRSRGILNIATGRSTSFHELADKVRALATSDVSLQGTSRQNPIVHRYFDVTSTLKAFPDFQYTSLETGLQKSWEAERG